MRLFQNLNNDIILARKTNMCCGVLIVGARDIEVKHG